jgi:hypothetical protein
VAKVLDGTMGNDLDSEEEGSEPIPKRLIDRLDQRLVNVLTALGFGLPVASYLWLLNHYSVNVVVSDQWDDVTVIRASYSHVIDWGTLWAQHNENRIFFPNLVVILLSRVAHFNIRVEEAFSTTMLVAAIALIIWAHKRRSPSTPWLYYCPVALLMLSLVQFGNTLWGFQMAWFMVLLALATAMVLLDRFTLTWLTMVGASAAGVVGSFSSLQGLLIWPVGLVLLYHRRRPWPLVATWATLGAASAILYLHNFNTKTAAPPPSYALGHLLASVKFFLFAIGDVVGIPFTVHQPGNNAILLLGLLLVVLGIAAVAAYGIRRDDQRGSPIGVALIVMGFLFAATITEGRGVFGYWAASASRYTTFDLLVPAGIYLALLGRPERSAVQLDSAASDDLDTHSDESRPPRPAVRVPAWARRAAFPIARVLIIAVIAVQIAFAIPNGISGARGNYVYQAQAVPVLRNIHHEPDAQVQYHLYLFVEAPYIRSRALVLEKHHLSVFASGANQ